MQEGLALIEAMYKEDPEAYIEMIDIEEMEDDENIVSTMVAALGSPVATKGRTFQDESVNAVKGMAAEAKFLGKELKYVYFCFFNRSFSSFSSVIFRLFSLAVLSTQRFRESTAREISSSFWLINAKSLISSSEIFPSRAIWISLPVTGLISLRQAIVSKIILESSPTSTSGT